MFQGLSKEQLLLLKDERVHLFLRGATYMRDARATYDTYRYVLFLKSSAIDALRTFFNTLRDSKDSADPEQRKQLLKAALQEYAKGIMNIQDLGDTQLSVKELRDMVTGASDPIGFDENSLLGDLTSFNSVDDLSADKVNKLFEDLDYKGRQFEKNVTRNYPFKYRAGLGEHGVDKELEFYWIPVDYLF
jgi:hypothetical protein